MIEKLNEQWDTNENRYVLPDNYAIVDKINELCDEVNAIKKLIEPAD